MSPGCGRATMACALLGRVPPFSRAAIPGTTVRRWHRTPPLTPWWCGPTARPGQQDRGSTGRLPSPATLLLALRTALPSHPRALTGRGPHQRLVVLGELTTGAHAGLDHEAFRLALVAHQRLVVLGHGAAGLDASLD